MVRFLVSTIISIVASAIGLIVAAAILDDMTLNGTAFFTAVLVFAVVTALAGPFIAKTAMKNDSALLGAVALVSTLIGLIVTHAVTDGLSITGLTTWILAAVIVWLAGLLAALIIPLILVKMGVQAARANRS